MEATSSRSADNTQRKSDRDKKTPVGLTYTRAGEPTEIRRTTMTARTKPTVARIATGEIPANPQATSGEVPTRRMASEATNLPTRDPLASASEEDIRVGTYPRNPTGDRSLPIGDGEGTHRPNQAGEETDSDGSEDPPEPEDRIPQRITAGNPPDPLTMGKRC